MKSSSLLADSIVQHAARFDDAYYGKSFSSRQSKQGKIPRPVHGIQHAVRVAIYIPILANLYRKYDLPNARKLTNEDITLIQIAALAHDSARLNDGIDYWDLQSALNCYHYSHEICDETTAIRVAEAIANKDPNKNGDYHKLTVDNGKTPRWEKTSSPKTADIYQQLLHDADCLDILRVERNFSGSYLIFHQKKVQSDSGAFNEMGYLIAEAKSLIYQQGDYFLRFDLEQKVLYQNAYDCFHKSIEDLQKLPFLNAMYNAGALFSEDYDFTEPYYPFYNSEEGYTVENILAAMREFKLATRGIRFPLWQRKNELKSPESNAACELRKTMRRKDDHGNGKHGNLLRSVSMGTLPFSNVGLLMLDIAASNMVACDDHDFGSGYHKHDRLRSCSFMKQKDNELNSLLETVKRGEKTVSRFNNQPECNEIICRSIDAVNAVYFTIDPVYTSFMNIHQNNPKIHRCVQLLQAVFVQQEFVALIGRQTLLPIIEISYLAQTVVQHTSTEDDIIDAWKRVIVFWIKKNILDARLSLDNFHQLKVNAIAGSFFSLRNDAEKKDLSLMKAADRNYSKGLLDRVNQVIASTKQTILHDRFDLGTCTK